MRGKLAAEVENYVIVTTNMQVIHENHQSPPCNMLQLPNKHESDGTTYSIAQQQLDAPVWVGKSQLNLQNLSKWVQVPLISSGAPKRPHP